MTATTRAAAPAQTDMFAARQSAADPARARTKRRVGTLLESARVDHTPELRRLEPVAILVACRIDEFTMAHVRDKAEQLGLLTGNEGSPHPTTGKLMNPRALAYLGALLPGLGRLGLIQKLTDAKGRTVYDVSDRGRANGNKQALWRVTERGLDLKRSAETLPEIRRLIAAYRDSGIARRP